jgi:hypothetical protein
MIGMASSAAITFGAAATSLLAVICGFLGWFDLI